MARSRLIVAGVLLCAAVSSAWGESPLFGDSNRAHHREFGIQTRYVGSQEFDGDYGSALSIDEDLGWGFRVGYKLDERFAVGTSFTWRTVDYTASVVDANETDRFIVRGGYDKMWIDTQEVSDFDVVRLEVAFLHR